jgi:hypothetical protein
MPAIKAVNDYFKGTYPRLAGSPEAEDSTDNYLAYR